MAGSKFTVRREATRCPTHEDERAGMIPPEDAAAVVSLLDKVRAGNERIRALVPASREDEPRSSSEYAAGEMAEIIDELQSRNERLYALITAARDAVASEGATPGANNVLRCRALLDIAEDMLSETTLLNQLRNHVRALTRE
jgi:hypothetical protein